MWVMLYISVPLKYVVYWGYYIVFTTVSIFRSQCNRKAILMQFNYLVDTFDVCDPILVAVNLYPSHSFPVVHTFNILSQSRVFSHASNDVLCASLNVLVNTIKKYAIDKHKVQRTYNSIANGYIMYFIFYAFSCSYSFSFSL